MLLRMQAAHLSSNVEELLERMKLCERQLAQLQRARLPSALKSNEDFDRCMEKLYDAVCAIGTFALDYIGANFLKRMVCSGGHKEKIVELDRQLERAMNVSGGSICDSTAHSIGIACYHLHGFPWQALPLDPDTRI